jgi:hypothetical protein
MKKTYSTPLACKLEFNYSENITASCGNTKPHHGDVGHGVGLGGGCDHQPGHPDPIKPHP